MYTTAGCVVGVLLLQCHFFSQAMQRVDSLADQAARVAAYSLMQKQQKEFGPIDPENHQAVYDFTMQDLPVGGQVTDRHVPAEVRDKVMRTYAHVQGWKRTSLLRSSLISEDLNNHYSYIGFGAEGTLVVLERMDKALRVYDSFTKEALRDLKFRHAKKIHSVGISSSDWVASGHSRIYVHSGTTGKLMRVFNIKKKHAGVCSLAFNPKDADIIAVGFFDGTVKLINAKTDSCIARWRYPNASVGSLAFHPHGKTIAIAWSSEIGLFDIASGECIREIHNPEEFVGSMAFDKEGRTLALCAHNGTVRTYQERATEGATFQETIIEIAGAQVFADKQAKSPAQRCARIAMLLAGPVFRQLGNSEKIKLLDHLQMRAYLERHRDIVQLLIQTRQQLQP